METINYDLNQKLDLVLSELAEIKKHLSATQIQPQAGMGKVEQGFQSLTQRQHMIVQLAMTGLKNFEIAVILNIHPTSLSSSLAQLETKLGIRTRTDIKRHVTPIFEALTSDQYYKLTGGLRKTWWREQRKKLSEQDTESRTLSPTSDLRGEK